MSSPARAFAEQIVATPARLAAGLSRLAAEDAVSLDLLTAHARADLLAASEALTYRRAQPVVGQGERAVHQDFEICMPVPPGSPFHACAEALEGLVARALTEMDDPPLPAAPPLNDLVVQRYAAGAAGISPHRDHVRYRDLVAIVTLAGRARFLISRDRSGAAAREVPIPPGSVLLMRAPGFAGRTDRPFHSLVDVSEPRVCLGLRHDTKADETG